MRIAILIVISVFFYGASSGKSFEGYQVWKIHPENEAHNEILLTLQKNALELDFWSPINKIGLPVTVMVPPKMQWQFQRALEIKKIAYETLIPDVEKSVQAENEALKARKFAQNDAGSISFDQYYEHQEINDYLDFLAGELPDLVSVLVIGESYENRTTKAIKISTGLNSAGESKPAIVIDGGIHAREWISPAVALYIVQQLAENEDNRDLLENFDWHILPVINPDGYQFTFTDNRFWRKTRSQGNICRGADANRNYGFHWMEEGASTDECSDVFAGPEAFSEVETKNFREWLKTIPNPVVSISFHSYAQMILYPYAYGKAYPENKDELDTVGRIMNDAIAAVAGTRYTVGSPPDILYAAAGASMDWAAAPEGGNVRLVYTLELPGGGSAGFDLPPQAIKGVVEETWEGVKAVHQYLLENP